jgi:hypothetical protein
MSKIIDLFEDNQLENREKRIEKTKVSIICIQDRTQQETHFSFPPKKTKKKKRKYLQKENVVKIRNRTNVKSRKGFFKSHYLKDKR